MNVDTFFTGDALEVLKGFPDNTLDSLVCDPPAGIHFMGLAFDSHKGGREQWIAWLTTIMRECLRVLKPGAHGLVWALPRTSHWTATALEDAGFEIRTICHTVFGTGWPKGQNIAKAIDKLTGVSSEVVATGTSGKTRRVKNAARFPETFGGAYTITRGASPEAQQWEGWNTQLKPSVEHWILVQKPLSESTFVKQVLTTGTGALNVGACAIPMTQGDKETMRPKGQSIHTYEYSKNPEKMLGQPTGGTLDGRYPSGLTFVHASGCTQETCVAGCPVAIVDSENPEQKVSHEYPAETSTAGVSRFYARFFYDDEYLLHYFTKASPKERKTVLGSGENDHETLKSLSLMRYLVRLITPPEGIVLDCFAGSGTTCEAAYREGFHFIGIEKESHYNDLAQKRIAWMKGTAQ